jgi:hypothetical protein
VRGARQRRLSQAMVLLLRRQVWRRLRAAREPWLPDAYISRCRTRRESVRRVHGDDHPTPRIGQPYPLRILGDARSIVGPRPEHAVKDPLPVLEAIALQADGVGPRTMLRPKRAVDGQARTVTDGVPAHRPSQSGRLAHAEHRPIRGFDVARPVHGPEPERVRAERCHGDRTRVRGLKSTIQGVLRRRDA